MQQLSAYAFYVECMYISVKCMYIYVKSMYIYVLVRVHVYLRVSWVQVYLCTSMVYV